MTTPHGPCLCPRAMSMSDAGLCLMCAVLGFGLGMFVADMLLM